LPCSPRQAQFPGQPSVHETLSILRVPGQVRSCVQPDRTEGDRARTTAAVAAAARLSISACSRCKRQAAATMAAAAVRTGGNPICLQSSVISFRIIKRTATRTRIFSNPGRAGSRSHGPAAPHRESPNPTHAPPETTQLRHTLRASMKQSVTQPPALFIHCVAWLCTIHIDTARTSKPREIVYLLDL
jgi:hypothetical protein